MKSTLNEWRHSFFMRTCHLGKLIVLVIYLQCELCSDCFVYDTQAYVIIFVF